MRWILTFLIALPISLLGADGDITGIAISTNGWIAQVYIASSGAMNTNGTLSTGFSSNNIVTGLEKMVISVGSCGFNDDTSTNLTGRTIYGKKLARMAYPNNSYKATYNDGTTLLLNVILSDYIFSSDVITNAILKSGLYATNSMTSASATWTTVTNNSIATHPRCIANWTLPAFRKSAGGNLEMRLSAWHRSGQNGRPVRCIQVSGTGVTSGLSVTNTLTNATIEPSYLDATPICEYVTTLSLAGFTQGENVLCRAVVYPWIGDSGSILDSSTSGFPSVSCNFGPHTNLCDVSSSYASSWAFVSPSGNDATGAATNGSFVTSFPFASIGKAARSIAQTNFTLYSHGDLGGGIIYLDAGGYNWTGTSQASYSNTPPTYCTITHAPGLGVNDCFITNYAGDKELSKRVKFSGVTISNLYTQIATPLFHGTSASAWWWDQCLFNCYSNKTFGTGGQYWFTSDSFVQVNGGIQPYSGQNNPMAFRGCTFGNKDAVIEPTLFIGNIKTNKDVIATTIWLQSEITSMNGLIPDNLIYAFNRFYAWTNNADLCLIGVKSNTTGIVVAQNLFESGKSLAELMRLSADTSAAGLTNNNTLVWNNTFAGERFNFGYESSSAQYRDLWGVQNNLADDFNLKDDIFGTNASYTNNWCVMNGVGTWGNVDAETAWNGATPNFMPEEGGMYSYTATTTNAPAWIGFVDRQTPLTSGGLGNGFGTYRVLSQNPLQTLQCNWLLPFDIEGVPRGNFDPPGAYASASPRKGAGFFAP